MPESEIATNQAISHPDGTLTSLGDVWGGRNIQRLPLQPEEAIDWQIELHKVALPFRDDHAKILGWGVHSLAFTIDTAGSHRYVAVLNQKPSYQSRFGEGIREEWAKAQLINREFSEFTLPQWLVITEGLNQHKPAMLRVAPEVAGATLHEMGLLHFAYNPDLLRQWSEFTRGRIRHFLRTGEMVDIIGHLPKSSARMTLEQMGVLPFSSSNLMVDYARNKLVLVDCEPLANFHESNLKWKFLLTSQATGAAVGYLAAQGLIFAHSLRDRLFAQPTRLEQVRAADPENNCFLEGLTDTVDTLDRSGLNYRVVGSVATTAYIQRHGIDFHLTSRRDNSSRRDIDIIILDGQKDEVHRLQNQFDQKRRTRPAYPEVSLHPVLQLELLTDQDFKTPRFQIFIRRIAIDNAGHTYLVFRDIQEEIPASFFDPVYQSYDGIRFPTVDIGVLVGLTLTRNGGFRAKDFKRLPLLDLGPYDIPREFIDFTKELRTTYPAIYRNTGLRELIFHLSGGYLLGGRLSQLRQALKDKFLPFAPKKIAAEMEI